jgi:hypothetical protein
MRELIERDYRVVIRKCPPRVKAFTVKNRAEDYYTLVIDSDLDEDGRLNAYMHELRHIENDDFDRDRIADAAELIAHGIASDAGDG